jgi:cytochrome c biogenesis protein CcmG, thiol:disulfide interchange protein DsbE
MKTGIVNRFLWPAIAVLALFAVFTFALKRIGSGELVVSEIPSPLIGKVAPVIDLPAIAGPAPRFTSTEMLGKPWLLNVWGTWCPACREEHPALMQLSLTIGVPIIGLDWKDDATAARAWLESLGNPYAAVAFDPVGKTAIDYGVYGAPETFLIGADGKILAKHIGPLTAEVWETRLKPKLPASGGGP